MNIIDVGLKFKRQPEPRLLTDFIVIHHSGVDIPQSVETINEYYKNRTDDDYLGIGYHYYIRKDGTIYRGRPENTVGGHCKGYNSVSVGVCLEGNYEVAHQMPEEQYKSGVALLIDIRTRYKVGIIKHKDKCKTDCPGKYFPFDTMVKDVLTFAESYTTNSVATTKNPYSEPIRNLKYIPLFHMKGNDVKWLQTELNASGYKLSVDGDFGPKTRDAVKNYQWKHILTVDGIVGIKTRRSLKTN